MDAAYNTNRLLLNFKASTGEDWGPLRDYQIDEYLVITLDTSSITDNHDHELVLQRSLDQISLQTLTTMLPLDLIVLFLEHLKVYI